MFLSIDKSIPFVVMKNRGDGDVEAGLTNMSWESVLGLLTSHEVRKSKNGMAIIPARFKPISEWVLSTPLDDSEPTFRHAGNIEAITMGIIDLDNPGAIDGARKIFAPYEHVIYSTHSYTSESPYKFRIVLKLDEEISAEDWPMAFQCLVSQVDADKQCGNLSRIYYLPSASPNAGVRPVAVHNRGRAIRLSEIYELGGNNIDFEARNKSIEKKERRHFTGHKVMGSNVIERLEWTWESMVNRHEKLLAELRYTDNRHNFATRIASSEVSRFGEKIDIPSVVQFIYKAALEYSSKPLTQGNTHKELPELFHSAFIKYASNDDALAELQSRTGLSLKNLIENAKGIASLAQATRRWPIDERITVLQKQAAPSGNELRRIYASEMKKVMSHADPLQYFAGLVKTSIEHYGKLDCDQVCSFFIETYGNFIKIHRPDLDDKIEVSRASQVIMQSESLLPEEAGEYKRFINASLKKNLIKNNNKISLGL